MPLKHCIAASCQWGRLQAPLFSKRLPLLLGVVEELQEAFDDFLQSDDKVLKRENDAKAERSVRKQKYLVLLEKMRSTYLGFLAHPKFGEDAPVLSRLGKVRKSERKTGLTRKRKEEEPDPGGSEE